MYQIPIYAELTAMTTNTGWRTILAIVGGLLVGLGIGGGAAAIVESVTTAASTVPIVISGVGLGLGIGLIVACLARVNEPQKSEARLRTLA